MKYLLFIVLMFSQLALAVPVTIITTWDAPTVDTNGNPIIGELSYKQYYGNPGGPFAEESTIETNTTIQFESESGTIETYVISCAGDLCGDPKDSTRIIAQCAAAPLMPQIAISITCSKQGG